MGTFFYKKLAKDGIRKNRRLFVPYILSCAGMIAMFYILHALAMADSILKMRGGSEIGLVLGLGKFVVALFSLLFLFYTNAFLVKKRYKEFGLYNVLGMDKHGLCRIIVWESVIVYVRSMIIGLCIGAAFFKFAELLLFKIIGFEVNYEFKISWSCLLDTALVFLIISALILLNSIRRVRRLNALELLRNESMAEKPPKANWIPAIIGFGLLGYAYYIANNVKDVASAIWIFFLAVLMVIPATYMIFISGSVALCRLLSGNKKLYYRKSNFVSVSSMSFRLKRNGAGLASICILATMVLVIVSSTSSLFFGKESAIRGRFPMDNEIKFTCYKSENISASAKKEIEKAAEDVFKEYNVSPKKVLSYRYGAIAGLFEKDDLKPNVSDNAYIDFFDSLRMAFFITAEDYNSIMGTNIMPGEGQAYVYPFRTQFNNKSANFNGSKIEIIGQLDACFDVGDANSMLVPSLIFVISDFDQVASLEGLEDSYGDKMYSLTHYYGYDIDCEDEVSIAVIAAQSTAVRELPLVNAVDSGYSVYSDSIARERYDFYTSFGGLFFVGIILSVIFIFAAAMIMYYKQISEGYEDMSRFAIMKRVGMTNEDIKKSIDSQILIVFFSPLVVAAVHLCFAFKTVWMILRLFNLSDFGVFLWATAAAFALFVIIYLIIYKITSKAYYSIVSSGKLV